MKNRYLDIMEKVLSAYSDEHILRYFNEVKEKGLTEHGFPRLTANIGILIAHGRRSDLLPIFTEMMDFCCKTIPTVKAANDFSVREIVCCLLEIEKAGIVPREKTDGWRADFATIVPATCYNYFASSLYDTVKNWALFTGVSEYFRLDAGIGGDIDFIDMQLGQQLQWMDENGMYLDHPSDPDYYHPVQYDLVSRGLFCMALNRGYRGKYYTVIDALLKKAGLMTLDMQSPSGEVPFGGRSNQYLHNEAMLAVSLEYEAKRYAREGKPELAARFKAATDRALSAIEGWLKKEPISHIKNRYPFDSMYGCEPYGYFDKYMITAASMLYAAYLICEDVPFEPSADLKPTVAMTSHYFHKLFVKAGGYGLEFDLFGHELHDASGLGRVHRTGAPAAICLSCPFPATPKYRIDTKPFSFSLCSAVKHTGQWLFGAKFGNSYTVLDRSANDVSASASLLCKFVGGKEVREFYTVNEEGVLISLQSDGVFGFALPALEFDGEKHTEITVTDNTLTVAYEGWICKYTTSGKIESLDRTVGNRNGHYLAYIATGKNIMHIKIEITKA